MKKVLNFLLIIIAFLVIVIPNAFQLTSIVLMAVASFLIFITTKRLYDISIVFFWAVLSIIFTGYILISEIAANDTLELIFKYVISPFLWITIISYVRKEFDYEFLIKKLIIFAFIGNLSVLVLYIAMSMGLVSLVQIFIDNPNIDQGTGLGFTLHVYGSLIFFAISVAPSMTYIKKMSHKVIYLFSFFVAAILSGRTALVLFVFVGLFVFFFYFKKLKINPTTIFMTAFFLLIVGGFTMQKYSENFDVGFVDYISNLHFSKIKESGGNERSIQTQQIIEKINEYPLGIGFIKLEIIRDYEKTYNYEVLILSTLMRFGFITFVLILFSLSNFFTGILRWRSYKVQVRDFFALGFMAIIISSFTNPYLESFCFQWMFFMPLILLKEKFTYRQL